METSIHSLLKRIDPFLFELGSLHYRYGAGLAATLPQAQVYRDFDEFTRATRSHTLPGPTADTAAILVALQRLLHDAAGLIREQGITLIGVSLANLDNADAIQLELPSDRRDTRSLDSALDRVRDRYGSSSVTRGVLLGTDQGLTVPLLPD